MAAWSDEGIRRAAHFMEFTHERPIGNDSDDRFTGWILNALYPSLETKFKAVLPCKEGKIMGFCDWSHA